MVLVTVSPVKVPLLSKIFELLTVGAVKDASLVKVPALVTVSLVTVPLLSKIFVLFRVGAVKDTSLVKVPALVTVVAEKVSVF